MISRLFRFRGTNSLRHVYKQGRTIRSEACSLKYTPSRRQGYRLAVVVSKKVSKSAVVRNRIRRRLYEQARQYLDRHCSYDMILVAYDERLASMPAREVEAMFSRILQTFSRQTAKQGKTVEKS